MMRIHKVFIVLLLIVLFGTYAEATTSTEQTLYQYDLYKDGIRITYYTGNESIVVVPRELNGYKVIGIGEGALSGNTNMWCVVLPDTIRIIEDFAFFESSLREVVLPPSLEYIGDSAFANTKLTSVYVPESVNHLGSAAFYGCYDLSFVKILANISEINNHMFFECMNLKDIYLPQTILKIGANAFCYCDSLQSITNYQQIESIYISSFEDCDLLSEDIVKHFSSIELLADEY